MRRARLLAALAALAIATAASHAAVPRHASSRLRDVEDRLEVHVARGTARALFDSLSERLRRGGYTIVDRNDKKLRLTADRAASLQEATLLTDSYEGTERIRLRFEVTQPRRDESGHRVTGAVHFVSNLSPVSEKATDVGKRQPYLNEMRAFLRGLQADFGT